MILHVVAFLQTVSSLLHNNHSPWLVTQKKNSGISCQILLLKEDVLDTFILNVDASISDILVIFVLSVVYTCSIFLN